MLRKVVRFCLLAVLIFGVSGCVQESTDGDTKIFSYELWVSVSMFFGGLAFIPIGMFTRKSIPRMSVACFILAALLVLMFAPTQFLERSSVSDKSFSMHSGLWGSTIVHNVNLDDLKQVRITTEVTTGRRGRKSNSTYLVCEKKDGSTVKIPANNQVTQAAAAQFVRKLAEQQIPVLDQSGQNQ